MEYAIQVYQTFGSALGLAVLIAAVGGFQTKQAARTRRRKRARS